MDNNDQRPGEVRLPFNPALIPGHASVIFLGRIRSPWRSRSECPKNIREAREQGERAVVEVDEPWRQGLEGLAHHDYAIVLYWMEQARRDMIVQSPRHRSTPTGVFGLRSPARPNPIALATVKLLAVDKVQGRVSIDAIDCLDGTPLLDIKPWLETVDVPPATNSFS